MMAWTIVKTTTPENTGAFDRRVEYIAMFNFDGDAEMLQRFLYGGGELEIHPDNVELFELQAKNREMNR